MSSEEDREFEEKWHAERRVEAIEYLEREGVLHKRVADQPAWSVAPYVSLWAVESSAIPDTVGWWVICGDLPSDYVSASAARTPREALRAISILWAEAAEYMQRGEAHPTFRIGSGERADELAPLLASRAALLLDWVDDAELWDQ